MRRLNEPSHLDLRCLQKPIIIACGSESKRRLLPSAGPYPMWGIHVTKSQATRSLLLFLAPHQVGFV